MAVVRQSLKNVPVYYKATSNSRGKCHNAQVCFSATLQSDANGLVHTITSFIDHTKHFVVFVNYKNDKI